MAVTYNTVIHSNISLATNAVKRLVRGLGGLARFGLMLGSVSLVRVRDVYAVEGDMESTFNLSDQQYNLRLDSWNRLFCLAAYSRKANPAKHWIPNQTIQPIGFWHSYLASLKHPSQYDSICLAAYIRKAILSSQCIHRASYMLQVSSHMTTIQSAIWFNLQYISAKQFPSQYIHRTSNTQCKSERPFRLQYIFRVRHRLQYNGILVKAFRLQDNTLRVQYRNPGQVNTVFCIHFRFQYTES